MDVYKFNLNTYIVPPVDSCSLVELEQLCEERLQLYKIMDDAYNLNYKPNSSAWEQYVEMQIIQRKLTTYIILLKNEEYKVGQIRARRDSHISHWLLSLCYCRTKCLRLFFMNCELHWFVMMYKRMKQEDLQEFFRQCDLKYTPVDQEEKYLLKEKLIKCRCIKETCFNDIMYYKTKFDEVSNLVTTRKVFLFKGLAYFPESDLLFCMKNKLWKQFYKQLVWIKKMLPTNIKEDRLENFLMNIPIVTPRHKRFTDKRVIINLDNIDEVATTHFPLCMKTIHSVLRREHHLKYDCKMQYGIFLKWVGLSYQHAMELWKSEFTKKMSADLFDRKYSYLFKHQYGKVGGRIQYNPYSCQQILDECPGPGQHHGCPFKHWSMERLLQKCEEDGFSTEDVNDVRNLVMRDKYREACTVYFTVSHKVYIKDVIKSPNEYFEASYEFEDSLSNCLNTMFDDCLSQSYN